MAVDRTKTLLLPEYRYEKAWKEGERVLLTLTENRPRLAGDAPGLRRVDRYFEALAKRWRARWEGPLLRQARAAAPDRPWACSLDCHLTRWDRLLSLWWEAREDVGLDRPRRIREGELWQLPAGVPLTLPQLLGRGWRRRVLEQVAAQIADQLEAGVSLYYDDWPRRIRRYLSPHHFYLTEEGPVVFYPVCTIAPALEDFPSFPLAVE